MLLSARQSAGFVHRIRALFGRSGLGCLLLAATFALILVNSTPAGAQSSGTIADIQVVGTQRIDPQTVLSYLQLEPGQPFDPVRMDSSLKSLFNTGLFADVTLRRERNTLIVKVVENPIINRIAFEGNRKLTDETLTSEVTLRPRVVYTRTKVQNDVQRILELYRRSGKFAATVDPQVIQLSENRVDLAFEINEGPSTGIRAINFIGNTKFSDSTLRDTIQTVESAFWRFLSSDDTYDPDRLSFDRELLRRFYLSEGYADFRVVSAIAELTPDREDFVITFTVEEGERYKFGKIEVSSELKDVDAATLSTLVSGREGDWYNADQVETSVQTLTETLGSRGYAFVEIRPRVNRDREARTIAITYDIREGPRVYVERIDIVGNIRTLDRVIRREITLDEGDAFSTSKIRRSRQRLNNLDFFSHVDINNKPGSRPDLTNIEVAVQEKSTGELSIGAGFSSASGALGDLSLRERNLLGKGQDLRLSLTLAQTQQQVGLSFTEPYFLDKRLAAGFDVYSRRNDFSDESSYEQRELGGGLRAGYNLQPKLRHTIRYSLVREQIVDVPADASIVVRSQQGSYTNSSIGNEFFYDALNRRFDPSDGYFLKYGLDIAGLGGSTRYVRNSAGAGIYTPLFGTSVIASMRGEAGSIESLDSKTIRITDRFYLGGDNLRGFETAGVGPRDLTTGDAIGGNRYYAGTAELQFPLGLPDEIDLQGAVFGDIGDLWGNDDPYTNLATNGSLRASVGVGIAWRSPFGPIRVDLSKALLKEDYDKTEIFRFNFGTRF
jgi:outer membrane protein insertion porin family